MAYAPPLDYGVPPAYAGFGGYDHGYNPVHRLGPSDHPPKEGIKRYDFDSASTNSSVRHGGVGGSGRRSKSSRLKHVDINLRPARIETWAPQSLIAVLARKGLGKTYMAKYITTKIIEATGVDRFLVICGNRDTMHEWKQVVHPLYVHGPDLDKLAQVFEDQDRLVDNAREQWEASGGDPDKFVVPTELRMFVVFDDVGFDAAFARSKLVGEFACNHRHLGLDLIFPIQDFKQIVPMARRQLDYIVMLQTIESETIDSIYKQYVSRHILDKDTFSFLLMSHTQKRGAGIVIDNRAVDAVTLEKRIFSIQSPYPSKFYRLGSPQMLAWADDHYTKSLDKRLANDNAAAPPRGYYSARDNTFISVPERPNVDGRLYDDKPLPQMMQPMPFWRNNYDRFRPTYNAHHHQHQPPMHQHQPPMHQHQPPMHQHQPPMHQHQPPMHQHHMNYGRMLAPQMRMPPPVFDTMTVRSGIGVDEFPSPRSHGIGPGDRGIPPPHMNPAYDLGMNPNNTATNVQPIRGDGMGDRYVHQQTVPMGGLSKFKQQTTDEFVDRRGHRIRVHKRR